MKGPHQKRNHVKSRAALESFRTRIWCHHGNALWRSPRQRRVLQWRQPRPPARGEWAWLATLAPPLPLPLSRQCGRGERERETRHPEDRETHGGEERAALNGVRESGEKVRKERKRVFYSNVNSYQSVLRRSDVKQRRRCGVNSFRTVSETTCSKRLHSGRLVVFRRRFQRSKLLGATARCWRSVWTVGREPGTRTERARGGGGGSRRKSRWSYKSLPCFFTYFSQIAN